MTLAIIFDSVGVGEWFLLLAVILIVVGPKRLPSTARKFGTYYSKFRRAADTFKRQLMDMDTEINNAVSEAEKAAEEAASLPEDPAAITAPTDDVPSPASEGDAQVAESAPAEGSEPESDAAYHYHGN